MTSQERPVNPTTGTVQLAIQGDRDALASLWESHRRWVAAIVLAHMPRGSCLDDLLQDIAMTLVTRISTVREEGAFKPWLRTIAINAARGAGRRQQTRRALANVLPFRQPRREAPAADQHAAVNECGERLLDVAMALPEAYREPLILRCVRGLSYKEISQITGLEETTIETRIARARRMLREERIARDVADGGLPSLGDRHP